VWLDHYVATCLIPLAVWILLSGLDDLFVDLVFFFTRKRVFPWPANSELETAPERPIAILVPLWREHRVIGQMLEHNLAAIRYSAYDVFVGVYPNDEATRIAVENVARSDPRVHLVVGPHDGPTSKGDCLNWIYRRMGQYETLHGNRFEIIMTHDAEDLAHPESLRLINWFSRDYAMVQVPVLPLPTPVREIVHGLYCDEFAEFQTKDIPVRQSLGGFLPANGVGTGFSRSALDHLAATRGGLVFDPNCLTEDYENGYRLHNLGYRQVFLPIRFEGRQPVATREYFPRNFRAATRQRSRWVAGIALQGWEMHGWRGPWKQVYWLWRDRKGLVGNLLSPFANGVFLAGLANYLLTAGNGHPWLFGNLVPVWVARVCLVTYWVAMVQVSVRFWCSARIYGWRFAAGSPLRATWGNAVNFIATVAAIRQFSAARIERRSMVWRKTDHVYPRARLGELLVRMRTLAQGDVEKAARELPKGLRIGEYLVQLQILSEENLYQALSLQAGIPVGRLSNGEVDRLATRTLPVEAVRHWKVLPYRVETGRLHVATADVPSQELTRELASLSALELRFCLVQPGELAKLAREYLPPAS
jgi:adsorption protein B